MYPLSEDVLPLHEIATHWARDLSQRPPWDEVFERLVASMWRGELDVTNPDVGPDVRMFLLVVLALLPDRNRVRIFPDAASLHESVRGLPELVGALDTRTSIVLPDDMTHWDEAVIEAACAVLAEASLEDHSDLFRPVLMLQRVSRVAFERYCVAKGHTLPPFWFGRTRRQLLTAKAQRDCESWLKKLVATGPKSSSKMALWLEAEGKFQGMSRNGFDEIWARTVPHSWRSAGAPAGPRSAKVPKPPLGRKSNHVGL